MAEAPRTSTVRRRGGSNKADKYALRFLESLVAELERENLVKGVNSASTNEGEVDDQDTKDGNDGMPGTSEDTYEGSDGTMMDEIDDHADGEDTSGIFIDGYEVVSENFSGHGERIALNDLKRTPGDDENRSSPSRNPSGTTEL